MIKFFIRQSCAWPQEVKCSQKPALYSSFISVPGDLILAPETEAQYISAMEETSVLSHSDSIRSESIRAHVPILFILGSYGLQSMNDNPKSVPRLRNKT